jgi:indolepyruvate ferredoxin oxidoreductase alpha subunit
MLGNEAIARGLMENGCLLATSYPGTPASEILSSLALFQKKHDVPKHIQWAANEKVAFEIAYAGSMAGLRTAVSMKQVGLNVASDPLMSAAYMGTSGGFLVISADDPGPHSSQTEQDSRMMAMMAKIPVLDPDSPRQAKEMTSLGFEISETFHIPVMLRPTTRVCHSRQDIRTGAVLVPDVRADFQKDPARWAATPKMRYKLHGELEEKLKAIAAFEKTAPVQKNSGVKAPRAIIASGVVAAHVREILETMELWDNIPFYQVFQPFPLHSDFIDHMIERHDDILVIEETTGIIEMQLADRHRVKGKLNHYVPAVGELLPETIQSLVGRFTGRSTETVTLPSIPGRRPTLCAGCPHRASFHAIKKAAPKAIYTSDIGCYTLGLNLGAVDTVLCMGAAISQAAGFYHAYKHQEKAPDIVATIGDSTFFHAGLPALIDAVHQNVHFVLVILDNRTTAMTGNQPTPASDRNAIGETVLPVEIESVVRGCGIQFCEIGDPYALNEFIPLVKKAVQYSRENGPAVVIARHPCILYAAREGLPIEKITVEVTDTCDGCGYCLKHFECPALVVDHETQRVMVDPLVCSGCGVCIQVCPKKAIRQVPSNE